MGVVPFRKPESEVPHLVGRAECLACHHHWEAVALVGAVWLVCPSCEVKRGVFINRIERDAPSWRCDCGNDLFTVTPTDVYCPNCGAIQVFS